MTKKNTFDFRRVFDVLLCIAIIISGICLICGCLSIYYSGDKPYSREIVAETFKVIAVPIYICLVFTVVSFIWELFAPAKVKKQLPKKNFEHIINRLAAKKDLDNCDKTIIESIAKERKDRKSRILIRTALICIASVAFLIYALNGSNFHQSEINNSMIKAMLVLIPCMLVPFAYAVFTVYRNEKSLQLELELIKQLPSVEGTNSNDLNTSCSERKLNIIKAVILLIGIIVLVYGFLTGGTADVLTKAINICTECIGLG